MLDLEKINLTNEEAIDLLSKWTDLGYGIIIEDEDTEKIIKALEMAIEALSNVN